MSSRTLGAEKCRNKDSRKAIGEFLNEVPTISRERSVDFSMSGESDKGPPSNRGTSDLSAAGCKVRPDTESDVYLTFVRLFRMTGLRKTIRTLQNETLETGARQRGWTSKMRILKAL